MWFGSESLQAHRKRIQCMVNQILAYSLALRIGLKRIERRCVEGVISTNVFYHEKGIGNLEYTFRQLEPCT